MKVEVQDQKKNTLLIDLPISAEFMYDEKCYIKHSATRGRERGLYKVYNLTDKRWCILGTCTVVIPCEFTLNVKIL